MNAQDLAFLQAAQFSNLSEITEAKIALTNTSSVASREFADWMVGDHTAQSVQLQSVARQLGVSLPTTLDPADQAEATQLTGLTGSAFDQAYAADGVTGHAQTIAAFQQEIASGANPTLVAFAEQTLPGVEAHYEQASINAGLPDPGPGAAPPSPAPAAAATTPLSAQDQAFVQQAASGNAAEVAEGSVATQRGNPQTAELGRWLAADHTAAAKSLATVGQLDGFSVPATLTASQQAQLATLETTSASGFGGVYASAQLYDQAQVLLQFVTEAQAGTNPDLVSYAQSAIPVLEQHLAGAAELRLDSLGVSPSGGTQTSLQAVLAAAVPNAGSVIPEVTAFANSPFGISPSAVPSAISSGFSHDIQQLSHLLVPNS